MPLRFIRCLRLYFLQTNKAKKTWDKNIIKRSEPMSESYYYILMCLSKGAGHGYGRSGSDAGFEIN